MRLGGRQEPAVLAPQSIMYSPAALASAGSLLEVKNFRPDFRFIESESHFRILGICCTIRFVKPSSKCIQQFQLVSNRKPGRD